jgi:uncharacterized protein (DUF4213/DUF364 family)
MSLLSDIIDTLQDHKVLEVRIGLHWTAVIVNVDGKPRCGLASTVASSHEHDQDSQVPQAGKLEQFGALELARLALDSKSVQASIGMAAVNALMPPMPDLWKDENADEAIARLGKDKRVVLVGHFPFIKTLRAQVGELIVIEQNPAPGDLPAEAAREFIPTADVVALTSMTFINKTLQGLLDLVHPQAKVLMLGPTTPLSPVLFGHGIEVLSGTIVENIPAVLRTLSQGAHYRQVHNAGTKLVNIHRSDWLSAGSPA